MATEWTNPAACNCLALRQAARHVSQFYDQFLAPHGLRATQYSILARLQRGGTMSINLLAAELVMDRTTLGRNILPLQREGLISIRKRAPNAVAARSKAGGKRRRSSRRHWAANAPRRCARSCTMSPPMMKSRLPPEPASAKCRWMFDLLGSDDPNWQDMARDSPSCRS